MDKIFKIYGAYEWNLKKAQGTKKNYSPLAIKNLITQLENRVAKNLKDNSIKIRYNRLRATAGSYLLDGIIDRLNNSDALIFDITNHNPNVMFELGIAIVASRQLKSRKVFIICEGKDFKSANIPSDLQGYFITFYEIKNNKVEFHDNNSLAMSLVSEISDKFNKSYIEDED
jgi:hypothetical protein